MIAPASGMSGRHGTFPTGATVVPMQASTVSMPGTATSIIILSTIARPPMRSRGGIIVDISSRGQHTSAAVRLHSAEV